MTPLAGPPPGGPAVPRDTPGFETAGPMSLERNPAAAILMRSDRIRSIAQDGDVGFQVPTTEPNDAAMVSLLLAAQAADGPVAVGSPNDGSPRATSERRQAMAVARGIPILISGASV